VQQEKRSILIVDTSASSVFCTAALLRKLDYRVRTASSAEEALSSIAGAAPVLVIADAVLPKMSGSALVARIKQSPALRFIPVIIQTASPDPALREACTAAGCACYFMKPAEPDALYGAIQAATEATPRKHIRIPVALKARLGDVSGPGGAVRTEDVTSLSVGGLFVRTAKPEAVASVVPLVLLAGGREIRTKARVLYSSMDASQPDTMPGMGMLFEAIGPEDREFIALLIKKQVMQDL
jgi:CheY-like chemotaxis protein